MDLDKLIHDEIVAHTHASATDGTRPEWYSARKDALYHIKAALDHLMPSEPGVGPMRRPVVTKGQDYR